MHRLSLGNKLLLCVALLFVSPLFAADEVPELSSKLSRLEPPVPAPDFSLDDMDGKPHRLSDYRGKVILINFWATWCPPCRKEMPSLERVYQQFKHQPFMVLAVNQWESEDHVFSYMGDLSVFPEFPILFDRSSKISETYGVRGLPTSFVIDSKGQLVFKAVGGREFDHPDIVALIRDLLAQTSKQ